MPQHGDKVHVEFDAIWDGNHGGSRYAGFILLNSPLGEQRSVGLPQDAKVTVVPRVYKNHDATEYKPQDVALRDIPGAVPSIYNGAGRWIGAGTNATTEAMTDGGTEKLILLVRDNKPVPS